jgi:glyoxylase I family protein
MKILAFHHVCIQTEHYQDSLDFYVKGLGFELVTETPGFHSRAFNTWLKAGTAYIELQTPKEGTEFLPWSKENSGPVHIAVVVEDVDAAYANLRSRGYTRFKRKGGLEVYEVLGSKLFKILAPEGTEVEVRDNPDIK